MMEPGRTDMLIVYNYERLQEPILPTITHLRHI